MSLNHTVTVTLATQCFLILILAPMRAAASGQVSQPGFRQFFYLPTYSSLESQKVDVIISVFLMWKLRLKELKSFDEGHTICKKLN